MTKRGIMAGGKYGRLARFGNRRNGADGYQAYLRSSTCWCYIHGVAHTWAEHVALVAQR